MGQNSSPMGPEILDDFSMCLILTIHLFRTFTTCFWVIPASLFSLIGIMVRIRNYPQLAPHFRLAKYYNLPRCLVNCCISRVFWIERTDLNPKFGLKHGSSLLALDSLGPIIPKELEHRAVESVTHVSIGIHCDFNFGWLPLFLLFLSFSEQLVVWKNRSNPAFVIS
jgi:hypothetical protein